MAEKKDRSVLREDKKLKNFNGNNKRNNRKIRNK